MGQIESQRPVQSMRDDKNVLSLFLHLVEVSLRFCNFGKKVSLIYLHFSVFPTNCNNITIRYCSRGQINPTTREGSRTQIYILIFGNTGVRNF